MANDYLGRAIDTAAIREDFKDTVGRDLNLSDSVLENFIVSAGKKWTDLEDAADPSKECCDLLKKVEETAAKQSISDPGITTLIRKMDDEFLAALRDDVEVVAKSKVTAVHMLAQFRRVYTLDELNGMPMPGTTVETVSGNHKPDKVSRKDQTGKVVDTVWTNDFADSIPVGKEQCQILDDIAKEQKAPGSVPSLKGVSKSDLAARKSDASSRRNAVRSIVKRTIELHHQWQAVSGMPKVNVRWIKTTRKDKAISMPNNYGEGEFNENCTLVIAAPKPIWVSPADDPTEGREFSVTQFNGFDVELALKGDGGGTMADLIATSGRGADEPSDDTGTGEDMPFDEAQSELSRMVHWFNKRDNKMLMLKKIADRKSDPDGNDILDNIGTLYLLIKPMFEKNKEAYEALQQKEEVA